MDRTIWCEVIASIQLLEQYATLVSITLGDLFESHASHCQSEACMRMNVRFLNIMREQGWPLRTAEEIQTVQWYERDIPILGNVKLSATSPEDAEAQFVEIERNKESWIGVLAAETVNQMEACVFEPLQSSAHELCVQYPIFHLLQTYHQEHCPRCEPDDDRRYADDQAMLDGFSAEDANLLADWAGKFLTLLGKKEGSRLARRILAKTLTAELLDWMVPRYPLWQSFYKDSTESLAIQKRLCNYEEIHVTQLPGAVKAEYEKIARVLNSTGANRIFTAPKSR